MQRIKEIILVIGLTMFFISCNVANRELDRNIEEVISLSIEKFSFPLLPLPKMINDSLIFEPIESIKDSLANVKMNIAIYPIIDKVKIEGENEIVRKKIFLSANTIHKINESSKHILIPADTVFLKKSKDWKEYDLLYRFTKFEFNFKMDSCKVYLGVSRSALWGQAYEVHLERKIDNWKITETIQKEKW
jgi:hypothetical protein